MFGNNLPLLTLTWWVKVLSPFDPLIISFEQRLICRYSQTGGFILYFYNTHDFNKGGVCLITAFNHFLHQVNWFVRQRVQSQLLLTFKTRCHSSNSASCQVTSSLSDPSPIIGNACNLHFGQTLIYKYLCVSCIPYIIK